MIPDLLRVIGLWRGRTVWLSAGILITLLSLAAGIAFWALVERPMAKPAFRTAVTSLFSRQTKHAVPASPK